MVIANTAYGWPQIVALVVLGYLIGSIPVGLLITRWRRFGLDIRDLGSGNIGTSNIYRHAGFALAAVVGPAQFLQGVIPVLIARALKAPDAVLVLVGIAAVVGNDWPIWLHFDGGRGIAVSTGVIAAWNLFALMVMLFCFALGAWRHYVALGVLIGMLTVPFMLFVTHDPGMVAGGVVLVLFAIARRLSGYWDDRDKFSDPNIFLNRLLHDRRPGRPLVGHRTDYSST